MKIKVNTSKPYDIKIEHGLVTSLPDGFVVTDVNVGCLYHNLISPKKTFVIGAGEKSKTVITYENIAKNLSRTDEQTVVAFGGGVVGDIAGFVASTYKGGIPLIQIPTSLIAMVDSSVGGKTGLNLGNLKNYLRTFYQPDSVLIYPDFLQSLPLNEFRNGLAEVIKYAYLFGEPDIERLIMGVSKDNGDLEEIIFKCCQCKARVVEQDENDKGYRHVLNFGHTVGHAIELICGLSHGEAVSIGMRKELDMAVRLGLVDKERLEELIFALVANNLPIDFPNNFDIEKILELMKYDKKGKFVFAFDEENYAVQLEEEVVRRMLNEIS